MILPSMAAGSGSKGKETVSTVDGEMASDKEAEEKPVQAEEDWWSSDSEGGSLVMDDEDEDDGKEEDENALAQWVNTGLAAELGHGGVILVLFETPSGFAIFAYDGVKLYKSDAHESIWADFVIDYAANRVR
ncbi:uncharacterized protein [Miscanthus floridulus]|uniref:uncharacterized protein n=1 Tax=Miscanthus floridulus TaxID=154761 RepID=UPI0034586EA1